MPKESYDFYFDFTSEFAEQNNDELRHLERMVDKSCIEQVERMFNIVFASGIENNQPFYLTLDEKDESLIEKYDGIVDLTIVPRNNETKQPFKKTKLHFKLDYFYDTEGNQTSWKTWINSILRCSSQDEGQN
jgi:hypothetical protein